MKRDDFYDRIRSMKFSKFVALLCVFIIIALVIVTFIIGITGSKYFMGCLFLCMVVPVFMYLVLWIAKLLYSLNKDNMEDTVNDIKEDENNNK